MKKLILFTGILLLTASLAANAQLLEGLGRRVKNKVKQRIDKNVDKSIEDGLDKTEEGVKGSTKKSKSSSNEAENGSNKQSSLKSTSKFDFVSGEKVLYSEDFAQDALGELPVNWNASGKGEVVTLNNYPGNWLRLFPGTKYFSGNTKTFGENYTIEFDIIMDGTPPSGSGDYFPRLHFGLFSSGPEKTTSNLFLQQGTKLYNAVEISILPHVGKNSQLRLESIEKRSNSFNSGLQVIASYGSSLKQVAHYAIQVQKQRFRFWVNENKLFDVPRAVNLSPPLNQLYFNLLNQHGYNDYNFGLYISNIKIATGLPDTRNKLITEGKFTTTGILFGVNSDQIKPESVGVLKEIAQVLKDNANVKVKIVGHTDSDGKDADNLSLSKRRAAAVKVALENDFGIAGDRMETDGKGESAPIAPNTTKEGKAQNRRVEFIKL